MYVCYVPINISIYLTIYLSTFTGLVIVHKSISFVALTDDLSAIIRAFVIAAALVYLAQIDSCNK